MKEYGDKPEIAAITFHNVSSITGVFDLVFVQ